LANLWLLLPSISTSQYFEALSIAGWYSHNWRFSFRFLLAWLVEAAMGVFTPSSSCSLFVSSACVVFVSGAAVTCAPLGVSSEYDTGASQYGDLSSRTGA
jgi:hypothetical protein